MKYTVFFSEIIKFLNTFSDDDYELNATMTSAIELWRMMYTNKSPWLDKSTQSMNIAGAISAEFAKLVTMECDINISGSPLADIINAEFQTGIKPKLRCALEYALATGSMVFKPIVIGDRLETQIIQAGDFFPLVFDNSGILTECVFTSQIHKGKNIFTLLERHLLKNGKYIVENYAFHSKQDDKLGNNIPLSAVERWENLPERVEIQGITKLPFGLFCVPLANQIDIQSPFGVSVFSRAVDLIKEADRRYSALCWEYESKESAVYIPESAFKFDKETGKAKVPKGKERLYVPLEFDTGVSDSQFIDVYSPAIRSSEIIDGISEQLRLIEFNCSLAYGSLSNPTTVEKTAEEIRSSKERSYAFVRDIQNALEVTIRDYVSACSFWMSLYNLGAKNSKTNINFEWGDSIIADPDTERQNDREDLANGTLRPEEYRAKYRNETIEEALANLPTQADVII